MAEESKPEFNPAKPFEAVNDTAAAIPQGQKPAFDPKKPYQPVQDIDAQYGTPLEMAKTAVEQGLSGATLGASKVLETQGIPTLGIPGITTPEAIAGRETANPITSTVSNVGGTGALLALTGGLGALGKGATAAARVATGVLEGTGIGGINQATDDWSQNKPLDAQKIAASAGLGALLGGAGGVLGEKLAARAQSLAKVPGPVARSAEEAALGAEKLSASPIDAPPVVEKTGVQPTHYADIAERVKNAKETNTAAPLPAQGELDDALSRVALENPINPLQREALGNDQIKDIYQTAKESPGQIGSDLSDYERIQKRELVEKTAKTIQELHPAQEPTADAYEGGKKAIEAFTDQYQAEKASLKPIFEELKKTPFQGDILPDAVLKMTESVPGIANMFDSSGSEIAIRPYKTSWGIDKATYQAVKEAVNSLAGDEPHTFETLWNVRKGFDQHIDLLAQGQAPSEIRALKAGLMDLMQESTGNPNIREAFKRYAINEQQRQVIEKSFGASVGSQEFGQISKVKPEMIGDKIFGNTATVQAAKNILPPEQFKSILANWLSEAQQAATDKGSFSSNKFGSFLRRNQDALKIAFQDNPEQLQRLKDLTTISRIIPDAASVNPSGTAKTLYRLLGGFKIHDLSFTGLLNEIPHQIISKITDGIKMNELNQVLAGQALKNSQESALRAHVQKISQRIDGGVKALFTSSASQARKVH